MADRPNNHERVHDDGEINLSQMYHTLEDVRKLVEKMDKHLFSGSEPSRGLIVRVESVEKEIHRAQRTISQVVWAFILTLVAGFGAWVVDRLKGTS